MTKLCNEYLKAMTCNTPVITPDEELNSLTPGMLFYTNTDVAVTNFWTTLYFNIADTVTHI